VSGSGTARTVRRAGLGVLGLGLGAAAAAAAVTFGGRHLRRGADPDRVEDLQMPADLRVHRVPSHDGGHLHVVERGEGTPVLCAHGVMLSSRTWVRQLRDLPAAGFRVVAFDHRGHGDSVPGAEGHDVRALARDIRSVLAGTADLLTPPREARRLARGIGGAHLRLVPGGGHMLMLEAPEVLAGVLREAARPADGAAVA